MISFISLFFFVLAIVYFFMSKTELGSLCALLFIGCELDEILDVLKEKK